MRNVLLAAALLALAPLSCAGARPAAAPATIIRTPAALRHYLRATPVSASPLAAFTPGGRKRFLASLRFGEHGLGGFSTDDLNHDMTHAQAVRVLALFGEQAHASGIGLTSRRYARVRAERRAYARKRGCHPDACPESDIEQRYDRLTAAIQARGASAAEHAAAIVKRYDRLFGTATPGDDLRRVADPDLRLLMRATENVIFYAPTGANLDRLRGILAEMQGRGMIDDTDYEPLYRGLVAGRRFHQAAALHASHPGMRVAALPAWQDPGDLPAGQPTAITLSANGKRMTRTAFDLDTPWRIVVVASCHFSRDAARAIAEHPRLHRLFARHAVWLADQGDGIAAARAWNARFPEQPIHIAWRDREWHRLDDWAMPTFYIFRHGKVIDRWSGWGADSGLERLRAHLQRDGLVQASGSVDPAR